MQLARHAATVRSPSPRRFRDWVWGAIEFAALWRARWRVRGTHGNG